MKRVPIFSMMLCASALLLSLASCNNDEGNEDNPFVVCPIDRSKMQVIQSTADITYPFFQQIIATSKSDENFMVSPLSLTEVLAMLANGAEGETKKQILDVVNFAGQDAHFASEALRDLNTFLCSADKKSKVAIANSMWIDNSLVVKKDFMTMNKELLDAETFVQDLPTIKTMNDFNSWCDKNTFGCIKNILEQPFPDGTALVLANALYFKGVWKEKFDKINTKDEDFTNYDGSKSKVKMMHQTEEFVACTDDKFDVAEFPYGNGTYCMDVILPHEGESLDDCLKDLDKAKMDECFNMMRRCEVKLSMPRMELKYRRDLIKTLQTLGMTDAFSPNVADFAGISNSNTYVSFVEQVTSLKVDEEGTVAAAVTYAGNSFTSPGPPPTKLTFTMDRPFAFLIRERQTGSVLFIGRMVKF